MPRRNKSPKRLPKRNRTPGFVSAYTEWILKHRWWVMAASVLVTLAMASGMVHLGFKNDYRVFFSEQNPQLRAFEALEDTYTKNDNVLFALEPRVGDVFTAPALEALQALTEEGWKLPHAIRSQSLVNFQHTTADGDDLLVRDLVDDPGVYTSRDLDSIRQVATSEPFLASLVADDGAMAGVNVTIQLPGKDPFEVMEVAERAREAAARVEDAFPDMRVYLTGVAMINATFAEAGMRDMGTLVPVMYLVMFALLAWLLRSARATAAVLGVLFLSVLGAMGLAGYVGIQITPPSSIAPTVILTLAIADSVHLLIGVFAALRRGLGQQAALAQALRVNFAPIFLTSFTTVIGFAALNFSESPPYRDLGNITAMGVSLAWLHSIAFLPALLSAVRLKAPTRGVAFSGLSSRLAAWVPQRGPRWIAGWGLVMAAIVAAIPALELDDQFVQYFNRTIAFRRDTDRITEKMSSIYALHFSLESGRENGVSDPEYLERLDRFARWLRAQPEAADVMVFSDVMKRLNRNLHGDDPAAYSLPGNARLGAQYLLLYELSLPFGLDLTNQVNAGKSATQLTATLAPGYTSAATVRDVSARAEAWLARNLPEPMHAVASGPTVMFSHLSLRNVGSMARGTLLALVLITLALAVSLGSLRFGLLSVLPNMVPLALALGVWSLLVGSAGIAASVVAAATLGIVVDDTVHFLSKYLHYKRVEGLAPADAVAATFETVGPALVTTSIILLAGFSVLMASPFRMNWSLGLLSVVTIAPALALDLLALPPLLLLLERTQKAGVAARSDAEAPMTHGPGPSPALASEN